MKNIKKENILKLEQSDPVLYKSLVDNQYIVPDDFDEREIVLFRKKGCNLMPLCIKSW